MIRAELLFAPIMLLAALIAVAAAALVLYVLYDVLFRQPEMDGLEKLIWVIVVFAFQILGALAYLIVVRQQDTRLADTRLFQDTSGRLDSLATLHELYEDGALTDEEFEREKAKLLDGD